MRSPSENYLVIFLGSGKALKWEEQPVEWQPRPDTQTDWDCCHLVWPLAVMLASLLAERVVGQGMKAGLKVASQTVMGVSDDNTDPSDRTSQE